MRKIKMAAFAFAALAALMMTGCAKKESREITLMIPDWGVPSDQMLDDFTKETGIKVLVDEVSWDDIRNKISIAAAGNAAAADVVEVDWSWAGEFYSAGWLEPIELSQEEIDGMPSIQPFIKDGQVLALPYANDFRIAYYNVEHFKQAGITKAPETWEEVHEALKAIKAAGIAEYPFTMPVNADESATTSLFWMTLSRNGLVFQEDGTLSEDAVNDALTFMNQMIVEDKLADPSMNTASGMDCYRKLLSGEASFMVGPTSFVNRSNDPKECQVVGQIMPILLPGMDSAAENTFALPEGVGVTRFSKNKEDAKTFVKWFNSADTQRKMFEARNTMPTRTEVLSALIEEGKIVNSGALLDQSKKIMSPFPGGIPDYYSEMSYHIFNQVNKMILGNTSPSEACAAMAAEVKRLNEGGK